MCGISGIINFSGLTNENREDLPRITNRMSHRGPDHHGEYFSHNVALGHRRLAIVDLTASANQPMFDENEQVVVVFNGEIYNHEELRKQLEERYTFKTNHSDTEVIIYAFMEWGIESIKKFVGQFAIALFDKRKDELYLVRDRIGQKPLYYTHTRQGFYFASEASALFESSLIDRTINSTAVYDYLTYLTVKAPKTFYNNIYKLEAGRYMKISRAGAITQTYWDVSKFLNQVSSDTESDAIAKTEDLLEKSMVHRNVSDAPISFALSGGLDSSLNIYYSKRISDDLQAINIAYETDNPYNEDKIAKRFCDDEGINLSSEVVDSTTLIKNITDYLDVQSDIPIGDPNSVLMYILSKKSKSLNRNVLMVGEGGDEIGGYPKYLKHFERFKLLRKNPRIFRVIFNNPFYNLKKLDLFYKDSIVSGAHIHGFTEAEKNQFWIGKKQPNSYAVLHELMSEVNTNTNDQHLRRIVNLEYKLRLPEMILARIDYPSMASSVEARSPFVDHNLIEYSCTLPFELKMKNGRAKHLFKELSSNKLPDYILDSPKVGFGQLLTPFLNETLPIWFKREILDNPESPIKTYVTHKFLKYIYTRQIKNQRWGFKMWVLYALNKWLLSNE